MCIRDSCEPASDPKARRAYGADWISRMKIKTNTLTPELHPQGGWFAIEQVVSSPLDSRKGEGRFWTVRNSCNLFNSNALLEARVGIEPTMQLLQSRALPLGYPATGNSQAKFLFLPVQVQSPFNQRIPTCAAVSKAPSA